MVKPGKPEEKSDSDSKTLFKQSGISGIGRFVRIFFNYVQAVILTNILGPTQFGIYVLARNTGQVFSLLGGLGLGPTLTRLIPAGKESSEHRAERLTKYSLVVSFTVSLAVSVVLFIASDQIAKSFFNQPELGSVLKWFSFAIPIQSLLLVVYGVLRGHKLIPSRVLAENILFPISSISFILLFNLVFSPLSTAISAFFLAHLITLIYASYVANSFTQFLSKWSLMGPVDTQEKKEVNSFAAPLLLSSSADYLQKWADTFMLGILSSSSAVGIYAVSMRVGGFIQIPLTAFNMVFAPMISEMASLGETKRLAENYKLVTRTVLILSLPIFGLVVLAPVQILSVFGKAFAESHYALVLICFGQLVNVSVGSTGQVLVMTGRAKLHLVNSVIFLVLTVLLNWFLIPRYGIIGAAVANMITLGLLNLMRVFQIYMDLKIHPLSHGFFRTLAFAIVSLGFVGLVSYYLFPVDGWLPAFFRVTTFFISYGSLVIGFGLGSEEKMLLNKIIKKLAKWKK